MFTKLQKQIQGQFAKMVKAGTLYRVAADRDKIWEAYLNAYPEELRQEHNCNCCKSFIRQYGGVVSIKDGVISTLWDVEPDAIYAEPIKALKKYVTDLAIEGVFFSEFTKAGVEKNLDKVRNVIWNHFYLEFPKEFVKKDSGAVVSGLNADKDVFQGSLEKITPDATETVLELIGQNSLYRGSEYKGAVQAFQKVQERFKKIKNLRLKEAFYWEEAKKLGPAVSRIKNTAIGTLLIDLSEGRDLDGAVSAFEKVVAPSNYKRPTALATPKMIEAAKARLEELGLIGALKRRQLSDSDLNINNSLYVFRKNTGDLDIFDEIKKQAPINPKTLSKVEEISIEDFINNVLPTAKSVSALVENSHIGNFVSLVGPQDADSGRLFKYDNDYSWSYSGGVADSMRSKVVELGGRVDGVIRFTHSWNNPEMGRNASLMDLHVFMPGSKEHKDGCHDTYPTGQRVGWNQRKDSISGGVQDVDYTAAAPENYVPIENISFPDIKKLKDGKYTFKIHNWQLREPTKSGFKAEIEVGGQIFQYNHPAPLKGKEWITLAEVTLNKGAFTIEHKLESKVLSQKKWNIDTQVFTPVKSITLSPNHWGTNNGNKHYFFFLEGCKSNEKTRSFYNEQLHESLNQDRKVFELLANKLVVEPVENELSGVGFSETVRDQMFFKVLGKFERVLKVKF